LACPASTTMSMVAKYNTPVLVRRKDIVHQRFVS
jgi:hypothetical protein